MWKIHSAFWKRTPKGKRENRENKETTPSYADVDLIKAVNNLVNFYIGSRQGTGRWTEWHLLSGMLAVLQALASLRALSTT
jgi:hypothetical protein